MLVPKDATALLETSRKERVERRVLGIIIEGS